MYQDVLVAARLEKIHLAGAIGRRWRWGRAEEGAGSRSRSRDRSRQAG